MEAKFRPKHLEKTIEGQYELQLRRTKEGKKMQLCQLQILVPKSNNK